MSRTEQPLRRGSIAGRSNVAAFSLMLALCGCVQAAHIEDDRLMKAGFTKRPANPPELAGMKPVSPHHFAHRTINGEQVILWSDPIACNCVYEGNQQTLQNFQALWSMDTTKFDERVSTNNYLQN